MNKEEQVKEIQRLTKQVKSLKKNNNFLLKQHREFKHMAEGAGSKLSVWTHKYVILEEKIIRLESELRYTRKK